MLDSEEYLHLAIHAAKQGLHHFALEYLHKSLEQEPDNSAAVFLLAAEYAELGLFSRAIVGLKKSIEIDETLDMAYYQLALIYFQQGNEEAAYPLWQHLSLKSMDSVIQEFATGMCLHGSSRSQAEFHFDKALSLPQSNEFLTKSMSNLIGRLDGKNTANVINSNSALSEILVNAYKDTSFNRDETE